ncbi:hypothetical protein BNJ_00327 [Kaumoebavirus]|uniref:hypothetical protein n=1 Tax=Kaumoebavirus TaxID=1859492 RepID=UPI0009C2C8A9|nr:hypothetical protein BNJ_00327 [Kaumoebavirus]ARA72148.1 hypothetical protein BNJ_00327 [Kaumoebavirus]
MTLTAHLLHLIKVPTITFMLCFSFPLSMLAQEVGYLNVFLPTYLLILGAVALNQPPPKPDQKPPVNPATPAPITGASFVGMKRPTVYPPMDAIARFNEISQRMKKYKIDDDELQKSEEHLIGKYSTVRKFPRPVKDDVNSIGEVRNELIEYMDNKSLSAYLASAIKGEKVEPSDYSPAPESVSDYVREVRLGAPGFPLPDNVEPLEPRTN